MASYDLAKIRRGPARKFRVPVQLPHPAWLYSYGRSACQKAAGAWRKTT